MSVIRNVIGFSFLRSTSITWTPSQTVNTLWVSQSTERCKIVSINDFGLPWGETWRYKVALSANIFLEFFGNVLVAHFLPISCPAAPTVILDRYLFSLDLPSLKCPLLSPSTDSLSAAFSLVVWFSPLVPLTCHQRRHTERKRNWVPLFFCPNHKRKKEGGKYIVERERERERTTGKESAAMERS